MAKDLRHILAGCLTASMLLMLCNMIKKDHIDPLFLGDISVEATEDNASKRYLATVDSESSNLWGVNNEDDLKPCWRKYINLKSQQQSRGYIFLTLAQDPEYHLAQIADAVVVAKHLGATLVLPNIKGNEPGKKRKFGDIYDVKKFVESLDKKVPLVMDHQATEISNQKVNKVKVPNMVSKEFISSKVEPVFKSTPNIRIATYFPASMEQTRKLNPYACMAVFDTLKLRPELQESIDTMVLTLRSLSSHSQGRFIAVDYRVENLPEGGSKCPDSETATQNCIDANDIVMHLQKIGFPRETTIYLTLNGWDSSLEHFRKAFPNTYTKDVIIPSNDKSKFLDPEHPELRQIVDIYISSMADVYVPTLSNMFTDNVVARRIAAGKTRVLVPGKGSSDSADDYVPAYISMKRHWAYSCFC